MPGPRTMDRQKADCCRRGNTQENIILLVQHSTQARSQQAKDPLVLCRCRVLHRFSGLETAAAHLTVTSAGSGVPGPYSVVPVGKPRLFLPLLVGPAGMGPVCLVTRRNHTRNPEDFYFIYELFCNSFVVSSCIFTTNKRRAQPTS